MRTEIFCVTHGKDLEFCLGMARSVEKFTTGFSALRILVPQKDWGRFKMELPGWVYLDSYAEVEGKGMLHHEAQICSADLWCHKADQILHMDADCMFKEPVSPQSYMHEGKPVILCEAFDDFISSYPTRYGWKKCVRDATGIDPRWETMVCHPTMHLKEVYVRTREAVETHTGMDFTKYVLSCRNEFPQTFAEFPTLGAVAFQAMKDKYVFQEYKNTGNGPPETGVVEFWSHGGMDHASDRDHRYKVNGAVTSTLGKTPRQVMKDIL